MTVRYRELLTSVTDLTGLDMHSARAAAEATFGALARTLDEPERGRLLDGLPAELADDFPVVDKPRDRSTADFVGEVSRLGRRPREQAEFRARAVLVALAEQDPQLVDGLNLPAPLKELTRPLGGIGGLGPTGHTAALTEEEFRAATDALPEWTGDRTVLRRTVALPPENLDALEQRLERLNDDLGRRPHLRRTADGLEVSLRTAAVEAVTRLDIDLAHRVDEAVRRFAGGIRPS